MFKLLNFVSEYYHYPIGQTIMSVVPSRLKKNLNQENLQSIEYELKNFGISKIDYCEVRNEENLSLSKINERSRLFIAFYLSKIRVIDNFILY